MVRVPPLSHNMHTMPVLKQVGGPPHHAFRVPPTGAPGGKVQSRAGIPPHNAHPRPHRDVSAPDAVQYPREGQPLRIAAEVPPPEVPESPDLYHFLRPRVGPPLAPEPWMRRFLPVTGDAAAMAFPSPSPDAVPVLDVVEPQAPAYEPIAAATGAANSALFLDPVGPAASARPSASAFSGPASWTATGFVVPPLSHPPGPTSCSVCADRRTLGVAPGTAPFAASGSAFPFGKPPCSGSGRVSGATGRVSESSACAAPPASATVLTLSGHRLLCTADCSCRDTSELDELKAKVADFELAFRLKYHGPPQPNPALMLWILRSLWMRPSRGCPP